MSYIPPSSLHAQSYASQQWNSGHGSQNWGSQGMLNQNSNSSSQAQLDENRRQEILKALNQEREMRRRFVAEGRIDEFKLGAFSANHPSNNPSMQGIPPQSFSGDQFGTDYLAGMKDPSAIMNQPTEYDDTMGRETFPQRNTYQPPQSSRDDLVNKLLLNRRENKGEVAITQHYSANYENTPSAYQYSPAMRSGFGDQPHNVNNIGGFAPEQLYAEDVEYSNGGPPHYMAPSAVPLTDQSNGLYADDQYRQAVDFARSRIHREIQKKHEANRYFDEQLSSMPSDRTDYLRNLNADLQEIQRPQERQHNDMGNYDSTKQQNLPPHVLKMQNQFSNNAQQKSIEEMNSKNSARFSKNHKFDQHKTEATEKGLASEKSRATSVKALANRKNGDYMKPTVTTDLKFNTDNETATTAKAHKVRQQAAKDFQEQHTFKPEINECPITSGKDFSKEDRWKKLTEPKTVGQQKWDQIKNKTEIEQIQKTCPFKPTLKPPKAKASSVSGKENDVPLQERLLHEADRRKEKREKLKRELEKEQLRDCSFKPQLAASKSTLINTHKYQTQAPLHERVGTLQKEKQEKMQSLRMQREQEEQDMTFKPAVNPKSAKLVQVKHMSESGSCQGQNNVVDRLYRDASNRIEKSMNNMESVNEEMNRDYSFHPRISKSSHHMSEQSEMYSGNYKDFIERQQAFIEKQMEKREEAKGKHSEEAKCTFRPNINITSEIICEADPKRGNETEQERYMRLYKKDQKKAEVVKEMLEKEVYSQYSFQPKINKVSQTIAREGTLDDLAYNRKGQEQKELLAEELLQREFQECSFKPQITQNQKYQNVASTYDLKNGNQFQEQIHKKLQERQEKMDMEKRQAEYEQLKDCTFKPVIKEAIPEANNRVVVVRGLGRHMELRELQKKKEEDQRAREIEVFGVKHKFINADESELNIARSQNPNQSYTVPKPFELSKGVHSEERKARMLSDIKLREQSECTFKPVTNEGRNKQILDNILEDADKENSVDYGNGHGFGGQFR